jgi:hypothetical protein
MVHLTTATLNVNGRIEGLHVLPLLAGKVASTSALTIPPGVVRIVDFGGMARVGAEIKITPRRAPTNEFDSFEAKVEIFDVGGRLLGASASKSFFPQGWTEAQIQTATYAAYARHYQSGGAPFFTRMVLRTPEGVWIVLRVNGNQSAAGVTLSEIPTAYLVQGQVLTATHVPS